MNKQKNGLERFLAAPVPFAVEDENFVEDREPATPVAASPGDFLALMGSMLDEKMAAPSAGMRNDIRDDLAVLENQLKKFLSEELVPMKKKISILTDNQRELFDSQKRLQMKMDDLKSGRTTTTSGTHSDPPRNGSFAARFGVPLSVPETIGEIDRVLSELDPANPAANDSKLVEKVLLRSREVKLKNFWCTYGMPEELQLILGDGNIHVLWLHI
ncbi:MAG: hypothetical protein GY696_26140 [Gammaproteobacteria bacterium]|nr:hypothetical protein [Gammaproteobacteria bacterium]